MNFEPLNPSASRIKVFWILTLSFLATLKYSLKTVFFGFVYRNKPVAIRRQTVDKILVDWSSRIVKLAQIDWQFEGELNSQLKEDRSIIFMCNHASAYDIPLAFAAIPQSIRMIAKKELFRIPIFSQAIRAAEFPSIDRQNRAQAIKDLDFAREKMKSGIRIWMFPEGTRSKDGSLKALKKGGIRLAIDTNSIIIPLVMQDIQHILPDQKWFKMRLKQKVNVKVGQAVDCKNFTTDVRHQVSDLVYNQMQQLLTERD